MCVQRRKPGVLLYGSSLHSVHTLSFTNLELTDSKSQQFCLCPPNPTGLATDRIISMGAGIPSLSSVLLCMSHLPVPVI